MFVYSFDALLDEINKYWYITIADVRTVFEIKVLFGISGGNCQYCEIRAKKATRDG
jgi:hypothetical protein